MSEQPVPNELFQQLTHILDGLVTRVEQLENDVAILNATVAGLITAKL